MKKIALVIVTYNSPHLQTHIKALEKQKRKPDVVYIINNGSHVELSSRKLNIKVVQQEENIGPAGGFNAGEKLAVSGGYDYIILADDDLIPIREDTVELLEKAAEDPNVGAATCLSAEGHGGMANHYFLIKREVLEEVGYHFKPFFIMFEDMELVERIKRRWLIRTIQEKLVYHHTKSGVNLNRMYYSTRNGLAYYSALSAFRNFILWGGRNIFRQSVWLGEYGALAPLKADLRGISDYISGKLGRSKAELPKIQFREEDDEIVVVTTWGEIMPSGKRPRINVSYLLDAKGAKALDTLFGFLKIALAIRGKNIGTDAHYIAFPPFSLLARKVYFYDIKEDKTYFFYKNNWKVVLLFFLLLPVYVLSLPFFAILYLLTCNMWKKRFEEEIKKDKTESLTCPTSAQTA